MVFDFYSRFKENVEKWSLLPEGAKVLMWYSGGKDSCTLLDLLLRFKQEREFSLEAYLVTVPHMVYQSNDHKQKEAMKRNLDYWTDRGIEINLVKPILPDGRPYVGDQELDNGPTKCYVCEKVKSAASLNAVLRNQKDEVTIVTPHHPYDILGYVMELVHICGGLDKGWKAIPPNSDKYKRVMVLAGRCYPKVVVQGTPSITYAKPLIDIPSTQFKPHIKSIGIPTIPECCPEIGGEGFRIFKRIPMEAADLFALLNPPKDNELMFAEDYKRIIAFAKAAKILPSVEEVAKALPKETSY